MVHTVPFAVDAQPGDAGVRFSVTGNPLTGVLLAWGSIEIVRLCVEDETYAGVRACALVAEPLCGIVIFRLAVVGDEGALGAEAGPAGTAPPPPLEHAVRPAIRTIGNQPLICSEPSVIRAWAPVTGVPSDDRGIVSIA